MGIFLQLIFTGLGIGSIYALVALGFVLIYRATNVVNFAQGDFAMVGAFTMVVLTIDFVPFTRPYEPGHAKLKTRWPLYAIASALTAYALPHLPLWALVSTAVVLYVAGDYRSRRWTTEPSDDLFDDSTITVLDLVGARGV